jgi:hypothetical protein
MAVLCNLLHPQNIVKPFVAILELLIKDILHLRNPHPPPGLKPQTVDYAGDEEPAHRNSLRHHLTTAAHWPPSA